MLNNKINEYKEITTVVDSNGNCNTTTIERTSKITKSTEPNYIKLYIDSWCEFNRIKLRLRPLFLELVARMTYANSQDMNTSQIVHTGIPTSTTIMKNLKIKQSTYSQYLRELVACNAIKRLSRGIYQINPKFAGRGLWKYNPSYGSGGIKDLKSNFNCLDGKIETKIIWADDNKSNTSIDQAYRENGFKDSVLIHQKFNSNSK